MFFFDPTMLLLIPALLFAFYAQYKVKSAYKKYSEIRNQRGMTGRETAMRLLQENGIDDVSVEEVHGVLSDHYDPRAKVVRLSTDNYHGASLAALSVSAHEVGHAIQDANDYAPLRLRHSILPVTNLGSMAAFPLFIAGMLFSWPALMDIGILFFAGVVLFHAVTLPVEFNASSRAMAQLENRGYLTRDETRSAKKVLDAAAMTYVAAAAMAALNLVRLLILRSGMDD